MPNFILKNLTLNEKIGLIFDSGTQLVAVTFGDVLILQRCSKKRSKFFFISNYLNQIL